MLAALLVSAALAGDPSPAVFTARGWAGYPFGSGSLTAHLWALPDVAIGGRVATMHVDRAKADASCGSNAPGATCFENRRAWDATTGTVMVTAGLPGRAVFTWPQSLLFTAGAGVGFGSADWSRTLADDAISIYESGEVTEAASATGFAWAAEVTAGLPIERACFQLVAAADGVPGARFVRAHLGLGMEVQLARLR